MALNQFDKLKNEVINVGLCTRCGSCVGVCPKSAIEFCDPLGICIPVQVRRDACEDCQGWCYSGCSGNNVHFPTLNQFVHQKQPENKLLGAFKNLYVGYAGDSNVRRAGASGGIISAIAVYLLEQGIVDGVITLVSKRDAPWYFEPVIARQRSEILAGAQSKYSISPVNIILRAIENTSADERFAFIGIPCQVHSIRKLQIEGQPAACKIVYVIGSYCGNILHFDAVRSFLKNHGVKDHRSIAKLEYRAGEWPGKLRIELLDGQVFEIPKFYANYLIPFYMMRRCLTCTDLTNEFSDISGGDAWAPVYEERGKGFSLIIERTHEGQAVLEDMVKKGLIAVDVIEESFAVDMHSHMLDFKKRGAFMRMRYLKFYGRQTPNYGYHMNSSVSFFRWIIELFIYFIYWLCSKPFSRYLVSLLPAETTGQVFIFARRFWKYRTKGTKGFGISLLQFTSDFPYGLSLSCPKISIKKLFL